jgi:hypothetical protein
MDVGPMLQADGSRLWRASCQKIGRRPMRGVSEIVLRSTVTQTIMQRLETALDKIPSTHFEYFQLLQCHVR